MPSIKNLATVTLLSCIFIGITGQEYNVYNFNVDHGLAQSYVYTINQDSKGYLWVGTGNGLSRFDGIRFTNFTVQDSLANNFISCSYQDESGIWFGHMDGNISLCVNSIMSTLQQDTVIKSNITEIKSSSDGQIWASSFEYGLLHFDNKHLVNRYPLSQAGLSVFCFEFIGNKQILLGTTEGLFLGELTSDEIRIIKQFTDIPACKISDILSLSSNNDLVICTDNEGVYHAEINNFDTLRIKKLFELKDENIQSVFEDNNLNLWLNSFGSGLIKLSYIENHKYGKPQFIHEDTPGTSEYTKILFEDNEGNLWLGTYGNGLSMLSNNAYSLYHSSKDINVTAIETQENIAWIGTTGGLKMVMLDNPNDLGKIPYKRIPKDEITDIHITKNNFWLATANKGIYYLNHSTNSFKRYSYAHGILENSVTAIAGDDKSLWIGTRKGVCHIDLNTEIKTWYTINRGGLPHNSVNHLLLDTDGKLWVTTQSSTIAIIHNGKVVKKFIPTERGNAVLGTITEDLQHNIWICTKGTGVVLIDDTYINTFTTNEGMFSDYCYSIISDHNGFIWVTHRGGISRIKSDDYSIKTIQKYAGLNNDHDFNSNAINKDGHDNILFGLNQGLFIYHRNLDAPNMVPPVASITSISINNDPYKIQNNIKLPSGKYKLEIEYMGVSLSEPELVSYIVNFGDSDGGYTETTRKNSVTFQRLGDGKYNLSITAVNSDGIRTEQPIEIKIVIQKPLWKQWWFYVLVALGFVIFIGLFVKRRESSLRREKYILEQNVRERTIKIEKQKDELEKQRDEIKTKNRDITDSIVYARQIQRAIMPPPDLINSLLNDNFILYKPKDIVSGDFYWITKKDNKIILALADCTGHGVPGAIMSMLGVTSLNEIVNNQNILEPNDILHLLRQRVMTALRQNVEGVKSFDGMNLALCIIDPQHKTIKYSGAYHNLVHIHNGQLEVIKADRIPIGVSYREDLDFNLKVLEYEDNDVVYLFSDGLQDQFGGEADKKFTIRRLYETFLFMHDKPMYVQKETLETVLLDWMGNTEQTDDISVMGIRL